MRELIVVPSTDHPRSSRPDIDLEQMEALADPTLSSEVRVRNIPTGIEEKIQKEANLQSEYTRIIPLYLQLQEAIESGDMPDFRRVSASMPLEIKGIIDDIAGELMKLSLYASTEKMHVIKELETMVKRHSFEEKIAQVQIERNASLARLERLRAEALDPEAKDKRRAEEVVAGIQKKGEVLMTPMPVVEKEAPAKEPSFWSGIRSRIRRRLQ